ncbi:hypothetical protein SteCoe_7402 [Stentor coeruleus]|uniref:G domain-containing protein n=1 Tax=Stentor coeruleus TaxID=5963 RepID=A0A1R2CMQ6_9CILI|nr:hypothetical protein SteCoe_7402 [Stentor coeruleus]
MSIFAKCVRPGEQIQHYDYSFLLLGGTGVGKSTFINTLLNIVLESNIISLKIAAKSKVYPNISPEFNDGLIENANESSMDSQTAHSHFYLVCGKVTNFKTVLIIDTPGLSATGGISDDDKNTNEIMVAALRVDKISAILFLEKFSENRATPQFIYNVYRISNVIPQVFENSVFMILTFDCDGEKDIQASAYPFNIQEAFLINNSAFRCDARLAENDKKKKLEKSLMKSRIKIQKIFETIFKRDSQNTIQYNEMFIHYNNIMKSIANYMNHLNNFEMIKSNINNPNMQFVTKRWEEVKYHSTMCVRHEKICHQDCALNFTNCAGSNYFENCACMNVEKICCKCGCTSAYHYHDFKILVEEKTELKKILSEYLLDELSAKNYDILIRKINEKESEIIKDLIHSECQIHRINPRYHLSKYFSIAENYISNGIYASKGKKIKEELEADINLYKKIQASLRNS